MKPFIYLLLLLPLGSFVAGEQSYKEKTKEELFVPSEPDKQPQLISQISFDYPKEVKKEGISGIVSCEFIVGPKGTVTSIEITKSPDSRLSEEVKKTISNARFTPGMKSGQAVSVRMNINVPFK
ncbi:MAG: energy transducer TonB [Verrucomicrobiota bacterium]